LYALDILVSGRFSNSIIRYDGNTGVFKNVFTSSGELQNPNRTTGAASGTFVTPQSGGLDGTHDIVID